MKYEIDVTLPFVAIRQDEEGNQFDPTMGEYLCNPLDDDLLDAEASTGGFFSAEGAGVIESIDHRHPAFIVPAGKAVRFALSTWDEYDEMVVHWTVRYRTLTSGVQRLSFGSFKGLKDAEGFKDVPALGGPGLVVPRSLAD